MEAFLEFLVAAGPYGMFIAAFLAGSVFPLSSEAVLLALLAAGGNSATLLICATAGNVLGSLLNYGIGTLGKEEWITCYTKVTPEKLERGKGYVQRYGAWAGLLSWIPVLGELLTVAMGYMRVNLPMSMLTIFIGKYVRYQVVVSVYLAA